MNPEIFAEWLRRQGYRVVQTVNSYWFNQGPRVYQAFPYHWIISPYEDELVELLKLEKAIGLRYSTPLQAAQGSVSYHAVYELPDYDIEILGKWARKNVRRGLSRCEIEPISFERLAKDGFALEIDTLARQRRNLEVRENAWR